MSAMITIHQDLDGNLDEVHSAWLLGTKRNV